MPTPRARKSNDRYFTNTNTEQAPFSTSKRNSHPIAQVRKKLGISQKEFATQLNVHWRTVQRIELGDQKVTPELAAQIEAMTDARASSLFDENGVALDIKGHPYQGRVPILQLRPTDIDRIKGEVLERVKLALDRETETRKLFRRISNIDAALAQPLPDEQKSP